MHKATIKAMNQVAMWRTTNTHHRNWRYWSLLCQYAPRVCQEKPRHTGSVLAASVNTTNSSMINSCPTRSSRLIFRPLLHVQRSLRQVQAACRQDANCLLMGERVDVGAPVSYTIPHPQRRLPNASMAEPADLGVHDLSCSRAGSEPRSLSH